MNEFDIAAARAYLHSLAGFSPAGEPVSPAFGVHLVMAGVLLMCLPFTRLAHFAGVLLNPTLAQTNNPRQKRHAPPSATLGQSQAG